MSDEEPTHEETEFERLYAPATKQRVFVDCGFHRGEGITEFRTKLHIDEHWILHAFELQELQPQDIPEWLQSHPNFTLHQKAAWFEDGPLDFKRSSNSQCTTVTASGHAYPDQDKLCNFSQEWAPESEPIEGVDLWRFIAGLGDADVYLKLDVEGSEYVMLRNLLQRPTEVPSLRIMWVETHARYMPKEDEHTTRKLLSDVRQETNVVVRPWY